MTYSKNGACISRTMKTNLHFYCLVYDSCKSTWWRIIHLFIQSKKGNCPRVRPMFARYSRHPPSPSTRIRRACGDDECVQRVERVHGLYSLRLLFPSSVCLLVSYGERERKESTYASSECLGRREMASISSASATLGV